MSGTLAAADDLDPVLLMVGATAFTLTSGTPCHMVKAAGCNFNVLLLVMALAIALMGSGE